MTPGSSWTTRGRSWTRSPFSHDSAWSPSSSKPKEGLALNNGTAACTAVAAVAVNRAFDLASVGFGVHALYAQALLATDQSFAPFVQAVKPHPGQIFTAAAMIDLVTGSAAIRNEEGGARDRPEGVLIQDRYSLRCLPQYIGPIVDGMVTVKRQIEVESNSASDNPLVDGERGEILHTGNFLAQYTGVAMDQLRYHLGLMAKHIDVQTALLMAPEFNHGLAPSLTGHMDGMSVGLKSLQVAVNQMMPLMGFYGQSIVDRFPTHAEQFNQNVNSQAMNSANLARETLDVFTHFLAVSLFVAVQAVELRAKQMRDTYDAREILSPATIGLYEAARAAATPKQIGDGPLMFNDMDQLVQPMVEGLIAGLDTDGSILRSVDAVNRKLRAHDDR
ncbi:aromatic amino acid ammonia-lyase [Microbacterium elymi]|uniref:Aromatic amino acid ammonia-lyase n=1 Tax=Microbacterium elymi TaxID=2909587 RepID=A0ABY5NM92_9MICO|nr:aromatic amino acid ammonia-lyase [Microbacterium elymi]UUT36226.1 aromatic amino acid ammonia-lyase [Microbacterium elymi]